MDTQYLWKMHTNNQEKEQIDTLYLWTASIYDIWCTVWFYMNMILSLILFFVYRGIYLLVPKIGSKIAYQSHMVLPKMLNPDVPQESQVFSYATSMGRILVSMWCSQVSQQLIGPLNEHNFSRASPNCKVPEQVHMNASQPLPWSFHMSPQKGWRWCWHFECVIFQMVDSFFIIGFVAMFLYRSVFRRVTTSRLWTKS